MNWRAAFVVGTTEEIERGSGRRAVSSTEAAALLGVSERTLRKLGHAGVVFAVAKYGNYELYLHSEIMRVARKRSL